MSPKRQLRAAAMTRLSSYAGEDDTSTSPERQDEVCDAYALSKDWEIVARIADLDVSASDKGLRLDRPGLVKARALYPTIDVLLVPKLDRLARNVKDFMSIVEEAQAAGVAVVLIAEGLDLTTASGRFVAQILAAFAELEAATISQRTLEAVAFLAREGRHRGGNAPFGWQIVPRGEGLKGFRLALHPDNAAYMRHAVERLIAGELPDDICEEFTALGYPAPSDNYRPRKGLPRLAPRWDGDWLRKAVRQPILRGMQLHRGDLVRDLDGLPIRPHDALVTDAEWRALQARMDDRGIARTPRAASPDRDDYADLVGRVACRMCGSIMHAIERTYPIWSCSRKHPRPDGSRCPGTTIQRDQLAAHVERELLRVAGHLPGFEITEEERADEELHAVSEALDATLRALRDVDDDAEEATLLTRRRALRARVRELQEAPVIVESSERPTGTTFAEDYAAASDAGKATLLRSQVAQVMIRKGTKGRHGLDTDRVSIIWRPTTTKDGTDVRPGVVYRAD